MTAPTFAPERIVAALNAGAVAYVIVGGIAVAAHGVVRATGDLDVVPESSAENLDRLLIAQAVIERIPVVTADPRFQPYGVDIRW